MKKVVFSLFLLFIATSLNAQKILVGDMNNDNELDIKDVTELVNVITGKSEKRYISPVEVFIRENKLTGKFKVDGVEKSYIGGEYDPYNGHEYIDLGLSVKWASCNIGANKPEECGNYYAWGETATKEKYDWTSYKYCDGTYYTMNKYCTSSGYGKVDGMSTLDISDDVSHEVWGGEWRLPSSDDIYELHNKCKWNWTDNYNGTGIAGFVVTSQVTGYTDRSIFLPAAGCRNGESLLRKGSLGLYWANSLWPSISYGATTLYFTAYGIETDLSYRNYGVPVRAVCK